MKIEFKNIFNISNSLSFLRLLLILPVYLILDSNRQTNSNNQLLITSIILFAVITDLLDGYLARKLNTITEFGKLLDPLADKVFIFILVSKLFYLQLLNPFYFILIISRDIIIFTGGLIVSNKIGKILPSNLLGKITVLSIGIYLLLIINKIDHNYLITVLLYYLSIFLSFASVLGYGIRAFEFLKLRSDEPHK